MSFFQDIAMPLVERGFHVIPLRPKSKIAIPENFGLDDPETNMRKRVERWAVEYPDANVAVVAFTGAVCILDDDTGDLQSLLPQALPTTMKVKTSKGWHYYFKHSVKSMMLNPLNRKKADVFDYQADRKYVVGPGSIHPSGAVYTLQGSSYTMAEIPDWLVDWIDTNADIKQAAPKVAGKTGYNTKVHEDFDFDEFCEHYDFRFVNDGPLYFFEACPVKGDVHTNDGQPSPSATALYYDGEDMWFEDQATSCDGYGLTCGGLLEWLHENGYEKYPGAIWAEEELELPDNLVEDAGAHTESEDASINASATPQAEGETSSSPSDKFATYRQEVADIRALPASSKKEGALTMKADEKKRQIGLIVWKALKKTGRIFNVGNVAVWLDKDTREVIQIVKGAKFAKLLTKFNIHPTDKLTDDIGQLLGAMVADEPKKILYAGSYYDVHKHILYVNEWGDNVLKIDGQGNVTRIKNGDDGLLWNDGEAAQADPLEATLPVPEIKALALDGLVKSDILDTVLYDEQQGVSKEHAQTILMTALIGLFFVERMIQYPFIYFFGPGGSMKTSLATKVGRLLTGSKFRPTPATTNEDELKVMAINNSFLLLDEANNLKKIQNIMKSIATGAQDQRRELYTTADVRISNYQARIWMTANTADIANETVSSRMMMIDTAARTEALPYRSTFDVNKDWDGGVRDRIWTELIARLAAAMRALSQPYDIKVSHRMSDFFVFGQHIARYEGSEQNSLDAQHAMEKRQTESSSNTSIVDLLRAVPTDYNGKMLEAKEWASILSGLVPSGDVELQRKAANKQWVAWQFGNATKTLTDVMGMKKDTILKSKSRVKRYSFTGCEGAKGFMEDSPTFTPDDDAKPLAKPIPKFCECAGCKHCDAKGGPRKCARHSKKDKCSACRNTIPADIVDDMRADAVGPVVKSVMGVFDVEELD